MRSPINISNVHRSKFVKWDSRMRREKETTTTRQSTSTIKRERGGSFESKNELRAYLQYVLTYIYFETPLSFSSYACRAIDLSFISSIQVSLPFFLHDFPVCFVDYLFFSTLLFCDLRCSIVDVILVFDVYLTCLTKLNVVSYYEILTIHCLNLYITLISNTIFSIGIDKGL